MIVQSLPASDLQNALDLVLRVFMQFEAPEYPPEGVETFRAFLKNPEAISALHLFGAYEDGSLVGVLAAVRAGLGVTARGVEQLDPGLRVLGTGDGMPVLPELVYRLYIRSHVINPVTRQVFENLKARMFTTVVE